MTQTIIWTIAILTILGVLLAVVLYVVAEKFKVEEDPRIDEVEKVLPGVNCGSPDKEHPGLQTEISAHPKDSESIFL